MCAHISVHNQRVIIRCLSYSLCCCIRARFYWPSMICLAFDHNRFIASPCAWLACIVPAQPHTYTEQFKVRHTWHFDRNFNWMQFSGEQKNCSFGNIGMMFLFRELEFLGSTSQHRVDEWTNDDLFVCGSTPIDGINEQILLEFHSGIFTVGDGKETTVTIDLVR